MGNPSHIDPSGGACVDGHADLQRMIERLGASGACFRDGAREVNSSVDDTCLCILDEFDEAVMARRLEFRNGCGDQLSVELRNRRLHRADFASASEGSAAIGEFDAGSLSYAGAETLHAFLSALRAFCAPEGLRVRSSRAISPADPDETGVSTSTLRYLLAQAPASSCREATEGVPSPSGMGQPGLADFIADEPSWLEAWMLVSNGQDCQVRGVSDRLLGLSEALEIAGARLASRAVQPAAVLLTTAGERGEHLAFLAFGPERLALLVSPSGKDAFLSRWSEWQTTCDGGK